MPAGSRGTPRTPQEKKQLSYERDRVNAYGENDKAARKAIPAFKARSNRVLRRSAGQLLDKVASGREEAEARLADVTFTGLHPEKRKEPDATLGFALALRDDPAADLRGPARRRESARAETERAARYVRAAKSSRAARGEDSQ